MTLFTLMLVLGIWLLAGIGWCILFAMLGLRFEINAEETSSVDGDFEEKRVSAA